MQPPPERLGYFYMGAEYDWQRGVSTGIPLDYNARDLTTHAVCVGMTGSGKTGLCLGLLEEAGLDAVPAILIDPKGDISNLMLQFPELRPEDFAPWISPDDARRAGKSPAEYAAEVAQRWRNGLDGWGIGPDRIRLLQESVAYALYTPGSDAGLPINILGSLAAPGLDFDSHAEVIRERIHGTVNALLGLIGVAADPVQSREAILLAHIFEHFWRQNQDLDLNGLILSIQNPPVRQLGVLGVDSFFPEKERFQLAMAFNNLVASPRFQAWLQGEALDADSLLYSSDGKPQHSIFTFAHLPDPERMFFVTLLLESVLAWVRRQSGTQSLRALLYIDEALGFFPPVAQPPSKRPLMALLKQSRAVGLGCILATQNPADLDYKGLTNAGTWFIGRLQTNRDKDRVMEGLKGATVESGGDSERLDYDQAIGQLRPRLFLMHNVHQEEPLVFETRWVMSYLRGPLTRPEIQTLTARRSAHDDLPPAPESAPPIVTAQPIAATGSRPMPSGLSASRPVLDPGIPEFFLPATLDAASAAARHLPQSSSPVTLDQAYLVYQPAILGVASVRFFDRTHGISEQREIALIAPEPDQFGKVTWEQARPLPVPPGELGQQPARIEPGQGPFFEPAPERANSLSEMNRIARDFAEWLVFSSQLTLLTHPELGVVQHPDETEQQFKLRLQNLARERRDAQADELERAFARRLEKLEERLRKLKRAAERDESDLSARKREELIATGEMLWNLVSRRRLYRTASWMASRRRLASQARLDLEESQQEIEETEAEMAEVQQELAQEIDRVTPKWVDILRALTSLTLRPQRSDVNLTTVGLAWVPAWVLSSSQIPPNLVDNSSPIR